MGAPGSKAIASGATTAGEADAGIASSRAKAWATRRAKYGQRGHASTYSRPGSVTSERLLRRALALIVRLHNETTLSEGQCCKALGLDRVTFRIVREELS